MTQRLITSFFASSMILFTAPAQAQVAFSVGPKVGLTVSGAHFNSVDSNSSSYRYDYNTSYRTGLEIGAVATAARGHFALQSALLYTQKGYRRLRTTSYTNPQLPFTSEAEDRNVRLNYVTIPVNIVFAQRSDGSGFQLFAGAYASCLIGGKSRTSYLIDGEFIQTSDRDVHGIFTTVDDGSWLDDIYTERIDLGLQGGLGYRVRSVLFQATYSLGLRNLGARGPYLSVTNPFYNRTFQASVSYMFSLANNK